MNRDHDDRSDADQTEIANLKLALATARQIGIAVGIIMAKHEVTADVAFNALARASQENNRKVNALAGDISRTGALTCLEPSSRLRRGVH